MTDIDTMLRDVKRLDAEASAPLPFCAMCYGHRFVLLNGVAAPCNRCPKHDLTELHAYYRTAAPLLAAEVERLRGEVERLQNERPGLTATLDESSWIVAKLQEWAHTFGAALCPGTRPDSYGEGMRQAKAQVSAIISRGSGGDAVLLSSVMAENARLKAELSDTRCNGNHADCCGVCKMVKDGEAAKGAER